jgi:outer membrane biogenesis lipoprotein LolB
MKTMLSTSLIVACLALAGCGSSTRVVQNNDTCGKQMTDLQDALASGAMTQHEYDKARRVAIERCDSAHN